MKHQGFIICISLCLTFFFSLGAALAEEATTPSEGGAESATPEPAPEPEEVAENVVEARERVQRGEALFEQGNFDAALVEFQEAYEVIGDHPNRFLVLYNVAQCHERSFRYDQALRYYQRYLDEGGDQGDGRETVLQSIQTLERLLATVQVEVNIAEAEIWVDGRSVGTAPGTVSIPGGVHIVELRAEGHLPVQREVQLPAGGEETLTFTLERLAERFSGLHPAYFIASAGMTVVSLVVGVGFGVAAFQAHNDVDQRLGDERDRWNVTQDDIDRIDHLAVTADVFFGLTAAFAVSTVILGVFTRWRNEDEVDGPRLRAMIAPSALAISASF